MWEPVMELLTSPWAYAIVLGIAALDAVFPLVPSESVAITAGVLAGVGDLDLQPAIAAAAVGAFAGDSTSYALGRKVGGPARRRLFHGERATRALAWAEGMLEKRGGYLIVVARFVPGGRTATTFTAGMVRFPAPKFLGFAALAAICWASYAVLLGYLGGRAFEEQPLLALGVALAIAFAVTLVVEGFRHLRRTRS
ncbi:MAG TPA: DedA family protein [Gaiellaceae bacterium]|jgi:membrane protein DedA with SNARE-associated domain|nr:DedA family protein [Gaiellaceae bacterium]